MRFCSFRINGFGIFSNTGLESLSPGLTLFIGENGAGKSTFLSFLRALLFGFESGGPQPLRGGRLGGWADVALRDGSRYRLARDPGRPAAGVATITAADGGNGPALNTLLGGASAELFRNVFAFSLNELESAGSLESDALRTRIYGAGYGTGAQSIVDAAKKLEKEAADLFTQRGQKPEINKLLREMEDLEHQRAELAPQAEEYRDLRREQDALRTALATGDAAEQAAVNALAHVQTLERAWEDWVAFCAARTELEALAAPETFPVDGVSRLERLEEQLQQNTGELARREGTLAAGRQRLEQLQLDESLLAQAAAIQDLVQGLDRYREADRNLEPQREREENQRRAFCEALGKLGPAWTETRLRQFDDSLPVKARLEELTDSLGEAARARERAQASADLAEKAAANARREGEDARDAFAGRWHEIPRSTEAREADADALREARALLAEQAAQTARREQAEGERRRCESLCNRLREQLSIPLARRQARAPIVWIFPLGCLAISPLLRGNPLALALLLALGLGAALLFALQRPTPDLAAAQARKGWEAELTGARQNLALAEEQRDVATRALADLENALRQMGDHFQTPIAREADLGRLEKALDAEREQRHAFEQAQARVADLATAVDRAERERVEASRLLDAARAHLDTATAAWHDWLRERGLESGLTPETVRALFAALDRARVLWEQWQDSVTATTALAHTRDAYQARVHAVLAACGRMPAADGEAHAVVALQGDLETARAARQEQDSLAAALREEEEQIRRLREARQALEEQCAALLAEGSTADARQFRARAEAWETRQRLEATLREHRGRLELLSAPGAALRNLETELAALDQETLAARLREQAAALDTLSQKLKQDRERLGEVNARMNQLAADDALAATLQRQAQTRACLEDATERWALRKTCLWLLQRARARYEQERQPAVLRHASAHLAAITGGRYPRLIQPLDGDLTAMTQDGETKTPNVWNRGLKEQIYLCLRFGLIEEYSTKAEPLPLVMDDILVNCDPEHARRAVACLGALAERYQIFYLTCHPETAAYFQQTVPDVACYRIDEGAFTAL